MFHDLDRTLQAMLDDVAAPPELRAADVNFETPDKNFRPAQATVNLFLHEVKENRTLRDPEPLLAIEHGAYTRRLPPLRVDCAYLVTAWSNQDGALKIAEEHQLLGQALAWLARFDVIEALHLQGTLADQPYPPPALVAQMEGKQSTNDFWTALGIPPRPAFGLVVTIALDLAVATPVGPPVVSSAIRLGETSTFTIAGTVRQVGDGTPVAAATVTISELGWQTASDAAGQFRFSGLTAGPYTLQISASRFGAVSQPITVPATTPTAYDVTLAASRRVPRRGRRGV